MGSTSLTRNQQHFPRTACNANSPPRSSRPSAATPSPRRARASTKPPSSRAPLMCTGNPPFFLSVCVFPRVCSSDFACFAFPLVKIRRLRRRTTRPSRSLLRKRRRRRRRRSLLKQPCYAHDKKHHSEISARALLATVDTRFDRPAK